MNTSQFLLLTGGHRVPPAVWPPPPRAPLPPFPQPTAEQPAPPEAGCWAQAPYEGVARFAPPPYPDRRWHRGNFCGVRVPGLIEGGNDKDSSLTITWDWPRYSPSQRALAIDWYTRGCGYTHTVLSIPQAKNQGISLDALQQCAAECKAAGLFVIMNAVSDGDPFSVAIPWLEPMETAGVLDIVCAAWQVNGWYPQPQDVVQLIIDNGDWSHPRELLTTVHWGRGYSGWTESCACWNDVTEAIWGIHNRFTFQAVLSPWLDGHYAQFSTEAPVDQLQSGLLKILVAMPEPMMLVASETTAQAQYDTPLERLEIFGDSKGYLCTLADPNGRISYLNGGRRPDGQVW